MKKVLIQIISVVLYFNIIGCHSKQQNCNIDLMLCKSPVDGKLSDDARGLLLPFNKGDSLICLPQGNIFNTTGLVSYIKPKSFLEKIRGNITKSTTIAILREKIDNYLKELNLSTLSTNTTINIDSINKKTEDYDIVIGYTSSQNSLNDFTFKSFLSTTLISAYIKDSVLTKNKDAKILVIYDLPNVRSGSPLGGENSNAKTSDLSTVETSLPGAEALRAKLLEIADTKRSTNERKLIAKKVWGDFFYNKAYIENYQDKNDKNPEYWSPEKGEKYFTEHLVALPSIIDIIILSIENDKETQKISGLKVCEVYNGSKMIQ